MKSALLISMLIWNSLAFASVGEMESLTVAALTSKDLKSWLGRHPDASNLVGVSVSPVDQDSKTVVSMHYNVRGQECTVDVGILRERRLSFSSGASYKYYSEGVNASPNCDR